MTDGSLPAARRRLADAIAALCEPVMQVVDGRQLFTSSWYVQLQEALPGAQGDGGGGTRLIVVWIDCLQLLMEIDDAVSCWNVGAGDTEERLRALDARTWKISDIHGIDQISQACEAWTKEIQELLNPTPKLRPRVPCPDCGERWVHERDSAGEIVQRPALQMTADGCRCARCRTLWTPAMWGLLERRIKDENTTFSDTPR